MHPSPPFPLPRTIAQPGEHRRIALLCAREDTFASACSPFSKAKSRTGGHRWADPPARWRDRSPPPSLPLPGQKSTRSGEHRQIALLCAREGAFTAACSPFPKAKGRTGGHRWADPPTRWRDNFSPPPPLSQTKRGTVGKMPIGRHTPPQKGTPFCPPSFLPGRRTAGEKSRALPPSPARKKPPATGGPRANF